MNLCWSAQELVTWKAQDYISKVHFLTQTNQTDMKPVSAMCDYATEQVYSHKLSIYLISPCWGGCRHGLLFHWPSLSAHARCRWHTSSCRPGLLCQSAGLCSVHGQPAWKCTTHNKQVRLIRLTCCTSAMKKNPSAIQTTLPGLRHLCGWAWTSRCTSGGAP